MRTTPFHTILMFGSLFSLPFHLNSAERNLLEGASCAAFVSCEGIESIELQGCAAQIMQGERIGMGVVDDRRHGYSQKMEGIIVHGKPMFCTGACDLDAIAIEYHSPSETENTLLATQDLDLDIDEETGDEIDERLGGIEYISLLQSAKMDAKSIAMSEDAAAATQKTHANFSKHVLFIHLDGDDFYVDAQPVSKGEYSKFLEETKHRPPSTWKQQIVNQSWREEPVTDVSHDDAEQFANWANKRLPTEWELYLAFPNLPLVKQQPEGFLELTSTTVKTGKIMTIPHHATPKDPVTLRVAYDSTFSKPILTSETYKSPKMGFRCVSTDARRSSSVH